MKHKYADAIKAWADGGEIQYVNVMDNGAEMGWYDIGNTNVNFNNPNIKFRIKPKAFWYRVALFRGNAASTVSIHKKDLCKFMEESHELQDDFIKWLTDWQGVEI